MNMFRRAFSTAAATTTPAARPCIMAGVILKRNPIVVRDPTSFEKAYADYRRESIHQASAPYNADYFEAELRNSPSKTSKDKSSASNSGSAEDSSVRYMERKGDDSDRTRLDRLMTRSLYLVTRQQNSPAGKWTFPQGIVEAEESLVEAAKRNLLEAFGDQMSVWFVGNAPVAHCRLPSNNASGAVNSNTEKLSGADQKVFFMKSQIFSGQVHPPRGVEFAWLTKQELADYMDPKYYQSVKDCLTEQ